MDNPSGQVPGADGMQRNVEPLPRISDQELTKAKNSNVAMRAYSIQALTNVVSYLTTVGSEIVFALFDNNCCLLKLYGSTERVLSLRKAGVTAGTLWSEKLIGANAIARGCAAVQPTVCIGKENRHPVLSRFAIYFAPITRTDPREDGSLELLGGIAAITLKEKAFPELMLTTISVANEVCLHIDVLKDIYYLYDKSPKCMLLLDINTRSGRITINHHNNRIFELFDIPQTDLYFTDADKLFDPAPLNQDLWNSISRDESLYKQDMVISVRGHRINCIVSTTVRNKPNIPSKSVVVTIESRAQATTAISEKISNNAVLDFDNIVGQSPVIKSAIKRARLLANTDSNIMIFGESGVGKDLFAQAIHNTSRRRGKPFVAVNCGALPRDLIDSELFGYEGGAFTGAKRQGNIGKFELANGGTIFLDEVGELPLDLQVRLLRVVEQKKLMRLGSSRTIDIDVKIISATNANLAAMVDQKLFRADLYFRLSTVFLNIPPLRERGDDIILLAEHFIRTISRRTGRSNVMMLSPESRDLLMSIPWNGNVRELQNLMESVVQLYDEPVIRPHHITENLSALENGRFFSPPPRIYSVQPGTFRGADKDLTAESPAPTAPRPRKALTRQDILEAIRICNGNRSEAAKYLGVARKTLYRNMERLGIPAGEL